MYPVKCLTVFVATSIIKASKENFSTQSFTVTLLLKQILIFFLVSFSVAKLYAEVSMESDSEQESASGSLRRRNILPLPASTKLTRHAECTFLDVRN